MLSYLPNESKQTTKNCIYNNYEEKSRGDHSKLTFILEQINGLEIIKKINTFCNFLKNRFWKKCFATKFNYFCSVQLTKCKVSPTLLLEINIDIMKPATACTFNFFDGYDEIANQISLLMQTKITHIKKLTIFSSLDKQYCLPYRWGAQVHLRFSQDGCCELHPQQSPVWSAARVQLDPDERCWFRFYLSAVISGPMYRRIQLLLVRRHGIVLVTSRFGTVTIAIPIFAIL